MFIGYLYIFLFGEISIQILCPFFLIGWFFLLLCCCKGCLYIVNSSSLSDTWCASIFSHSVVLGSPFWWCPLKHKSFLILKSNLSVFSFIAYAFSVISKTLLPIQIHGDLPWCFFLKIFSALTFKYLIPFELIFVHGMWQQSKFILLCVAIQYPSTICWKDFISPLLDGPLI